MKPSGGRAGGDGGVVAAQSSLESPVWADSAGGASESRARLLKLENLNETLFLVLLKFSMTLYKSVCSRVFL